jgi:1,4-dihydroxy-2-naphthoyl-CoA synthase
LKGRLIYGGGGLRRFVGKKEKKNHDIWTMVRSYLASNKQGIYTLKRV